MKCPLCNDTGRLLAFTDQGVAPRCSCPSKTIGLIRLSEQGAAGQHQQEAGIPRDEEDVTLQAN